MTREKILLLEAAGPESGALVATAVATGIDVYVATHPDIYATYNQELRGSLTGTLFTDFSSVDAAVRDIVGFSGRVGINGILTVTEFVTPIVALACAELALPGNDPEMAFAARNKKVMSEQFAKHGVTAPKTVVVACEADLTNRLATGELGFPLVIKPSEHAGSRGVSIASNASEVTTAYHRALGHHHEQSYGIALDESILVQEYIDGTEYSIESATQHGETTHLCITRKIVTDGPYRVELGHAVPASTDAVAAERILAQVDKAIAATGIRNGFSHTEVKLAPHGQCAVLEIGARPGAGHIGFLIELALGTQFWKACLDIALGRPADLSQTRNDYATVRFLTSPRPGRLTSLTNLPTPSPRVPIIRVRKSVGDTVQEAENNSARLGSFIVAGPDQPSVDRQADHLLSQVRIEVAPAEPTP